MKSASAGSIAYPAAVEKAFGANVDHGVPNQHCAAGRALNEAKRRYSSAACTGAEEIAKVGIPFPDRVSTLHVERANLTMRMGMRSSTLRLREPASRAS
jgi:hypothetical protein